MLLPDTHTCFTNTTIRVGSVKVGWAPERKGVDFFMSLYDFGYFGPYVQVLTPDSVFGINSIADSNSGTDPGTNSEADPGTNFEAESDFGIDSGNWYRNYYPELIAKKLGAAGMDSDEKFIFPFTTKHH